MAKLSFGELLTIFLLSIFGMTLTPTVQEQVVAVTGVGGNNLTGAARTLMLLFPLFWVILMITIPVGAIALYLKARA